MEKESKNLKFEQISHFGPKVGKMGSFSHFGPQSVKKGTRNHLFNKPFGPGRKIAARMRFWAQNYDFVGQNSILGPKLLQSAFLDSKINSWSQYRPLAQKPYETNCLGAPFSHFWTQNTQMDSFSTFE